MWNMKGSNLNFYCISVERVSKLEIRKLFLSVDTVNW